MMSCAVKDAQYSTDGARAQNIFKLRVCEHYDANDYCVLRVAILRESFSWFSAVITSSFAKAISVIANELLTDFIRLTRVLEPFLLYWNSRSFILVSLFPNLWKVLTFSVCLF